MKTGRLEKEMLGSGSEIYTQVMIIIILGKVRNNLTRTVVGVELFRTEVSEVMFY